MLQDQSRNGDGTADDDGHDRNQQPTQAHDRIYESVHSFSPAKTAASLTGILVELTGIEPVASWLQTRRSPS